MLILGVLGIYFDVAVLFFKKTTLLFRLALPTPEILPLLRWD